MGLYCRFAGFGLSIVANESIRTLGTSSFVPAIPYVQEEFKVSREIAMLPLSLYTLGFLIGPTFAAPLSELYGRRCTYWGTMPLLLAFTAAAGSSHNFSLLVIMRFFAGFFGSGALAVGAGRLFLHTFIL